VFGVLNVVTSVFVDNAHQVSQRDRDIVTQHEIQRHLDYAKDIRHFFMEADKDNSGMLSWEEFHEHLQDPKVQAYFATLQLDVAQAHALFLLLDVDETNEVDIDEFVGGCMRLKGDAKSIDVNMLLYENEKMICTFTKFIEYAEEKFEGIDAALGIRHHSKSDGQPRRFSRRETPAVTAATCSSTGSGSIRRPSIFQLNAQALRDLVHQDAAPMPGYGRLEKGVEVIKNFQSHEKTMSEGHERENVCESVPGQMPMTNRESSTQVLSAASHEAGSRINIEDV